jgi:hypothetical protein
MSPTAPASPSPPNSPALPLERRKPARQPLLRSLQLGLVIGLSLLASQSAQLSTAAPATAASASAAPVTADALAPKPEPNAALRDQSNYLVVHADQPLHRIPDEIYGMSFADEALLEELALPLNRWGGNATTRYNWQLDASNRASDWFFENIPNDVDDESLLPAGSAADRWVETNRAAGSQSLLTLPLIGWTPKSRARDCGFRVSKYGPQQNTDPWAPDCGDGVQPNGMPIEGNDPTDTSLAIAPAFGADWVRHLQSQFGLAQDSGVRYYNLDNEPMLWSHTHRDVHPAPVGYDELLERTISYATAIKEVDAAAGLLGPGLWGWTAYFYSGLDQAGGGSWWTDRPDRRAHGDVPLVPWYLKQLSDHEAEHGQRLLDYLDLHFYPQADGVALSPAGDADTQARRLRSIRALYDPIYQDESWIDEPVSLIPRMHDWVEQNYPGTKLAITEYNWGGLEHINGALAQAEILGIFGQEGLDLAALWSPPEPDEPGAYAFRMFLNAKGKLRQPGQPRARFGQTALPLDISANSADPLAAFASLRDDGVLTLILINRTEQELKTGLEVQGFNPQRISGVNHFIYAGRDLSNIQRWVLNFDQVPQDPLTLALALPAQSISLLEIPPETPAQPNPTATSVEPSTTPPSSSTPTVGVSPTAISSTRTPTPPTEDAFIYLPMLLKHE